ncbi:MAG: hypothetical protein ACFFAH_09680 [Promethearchaeota archaeon]
MTLSILGWLNGITAFAIFAFGCVFGIYIVIKSIKVKAKLLTYLGAAFFCSGWAYSNIVFDFLTILFTNKNMTFTSYLIVNTIASFTLIIGFVFYFYIGLKLITPEKWKHLFVPLVIWAVIGEFFIIFYHTSSINFIYPRNMGEDLIYNEVNPTSPLSIISLLGILLLFTVNVVGFLYKSIKSMGILRKKYAILSIGFFFYLFFGAFEIFSIIAFAKYLFRIGLITGLFLFYLGLREEPEKIKKEKPEKDVEVAESIFILTKRPDHLTEEEIFVAIEKRICLVCKGKLERKMYICPDCGTFYCNKCSDTLSNLENMCWVCETPFDESKPVRLTEKKEEEKFIEGKEQAETKKK